MSHCTPSPTPIFPFFIPFFFPCLSPCLLSQSPSPVRVIPRCIAELFWIKKNLQRLIIQYSSSFSMAPKPLKEKKRNGTNGLSLWCISGDVHYQERRPWRILAAITFNLATTSNKKSSRSCVNRSKICPPARARNCYLCSCLYKSLCF